MGKIISIGNQSFESMREHGIFYIDKTFFIKEWWENEDVVTLITRPRRFGKTLNLSMMECFFSTKYRDRSDLFEGLSIWEERKYTEMQGKYPVIFLSFADIKGNTFEKTKGSMIESLIDLYKKHSYLKEGDILTEEEKRDYDTLGQCVGKEKNVKDELSEDTIAWALKRLMSYMVRYYGQKVIILLDEYDTPLQEAYVYGYWDELTSLIRSLFNSTFKTNDYLHRAVMTGITRISKESIFSDLNNLEVVTTTSDKYCTAFGFTEEEVIASLEQFGLTDTLERVRHWYNGFRFGRRKDIYNPWSITKYLDSGKFETYWANTSSNSLAGKLIREAAADVKMAMEDLLEGKSIETIIEEEIVFDRLDDSSEAIFSLLLASGYLKVEGVPEADDEADVIYQLSLTNLEVRKEFRRMIQNWFAKSSVRYNDFVKALFANDVGYMNQYMNQMTSTVFSFFDTGNHPSEHTEPERFYHGFVLGLIADAKLDYLITSNRESGLGRYDVLMEPKNGEGYAYIFEFKVKDPYSENTLEETLQSALRQIEEKNYDAILTNKGISKEAIRHYGFAFEGKRVLIG